MNNGTLLYAQSGGPTSVINNSLRGALEEARKYEQIDHFYAAYHGVQGILREDIFSLDNICSREIVKLTQTPGAALGSCRYKLDKTKNDDFERILEIFRKNNIRYFLYNGGNDSMDTCNKLSSYFNQIGYCCRVIGVPKTIDNDLVGTDHCPGYASCARFVSNMIAEVACDASSYSNEQIIVFEIMGRNAGWLVASTSLAKLTGYGPDLIYLPEVTFNLEKFIKDVEEVKKNKNVVIVAVSESLKISENEFIGGLTEDNNNKDMFGHIQMGGVSEFLGDLLRRHFNTKVRTIEFSLLQRAANHLASQLDLYEAYRVGAYAVKVSVDGTSGKMVTINRNSQNDDYQSTYGLIDLADVANKEKLFPIEWINSTNNYVTDDYQKYALPLISNIRSRDNYAPFELIDNGLPDFADLSKYFYKNI